MNHFNAGADEYRSPTLKKFLETEQDTPKRRIVSAKTSIDKSPEVQGDIPDDVLVVVSKLKAYIKAKSGLSTSADVMPVLSSIIRQECDKAIQNAHRSERKTVMARDFNLNA